MPGIKSIVESRTYDAGGNWQEGCLRAANDIIEAMHPNKGLRKMNPEDLSVRDVFDVFVVENWRQQGKSVDALLSGNSVIMAEAISTSQFPRILGRASEVNILDSYLLALEGVEELVTESTGWKGNWAFFDRLTGKELPERVFEGAAYEETQFGEVEAAIKLRKFGRIIQVTKEMVMADQTGKIVQFSKDFGQEMGYHRQTDILQCVTMTASSLHEAAANDWFRINGTAYAVYADTHATVPGSGGIANDNNFTSTAIGSSGYSTVLTALRKMQDIHGKKIRVKPTHVIVAPEQEETSKKLYIFNVEPGLTSGGQDPNIYKGMFKPVVDVDGTDGTWYMGAFNKQVIYAWAWKPGVASVAPQERALTHDIVLLIQVSYKGGPGHIDHRFAARAAA